jgi:hypothetical protein
MYGTARFLHEDGFIVFRNALSAKEVREGMSTIDTKHQTVQYDKMQRYITHTILGRVGELLQLRNTPIFTKFRVSDNNNSADASTFHRDVIYYGGGNEIFMPCFTCLTYFDTTVMEVIPGSHTRNYSLMKALTAYNKRIRITMNPSDILLFYSSLLHRGIFTQAVEHRRLVQIFEVFFRPTLLKSVVPRVLHIRGEEKYSQFMINTSKSNNIVMTALNIFGYLNAATGYGQCSYANNLLFFSSEGLRGRIRIEPETQQPINKYVLNDDIHTIDLAPKYVSTVTYRLYNRQFIKYSVLLVVVVVGIVWFGISIKNHII